MISFALVLVSLKTVALAALVGMLVCWILHLLHRNFCKHDNSCCSSQKSCMPGEKCLPGERCMPGEKCLPGEKCEPEYPSISKHDECCCNCSFACLAIYKLLAYALTFVQAYGVAYLLENFDLLNDYQNAIWLTLFVALTFWVSKKACCVKWHSKSLLHFACKAAGHLIGLASIAAVIVYLS